MPIESLQALHKIPFCQPARTYTHHYRSERLGAELIFAGIPMQKINEPYERTLRSNVKYRFVIDIASLRP